jgi:cytochrome P450 family 138
LLQAIAMLTVSHWRMRRLHARYGDAFTIELPVFGRVLVIGDPAEVRQLFTAGPEIADNPARWPPGRKARSSPHCRR